MKFSELNGSATKEALATKVDKVAGKGLSTEDYSTADKTKLQGISLTKAAVGLGNVDNTADSVKSVASAAAVPWTGVTGKPTVIAAGADQAAARATIGAGTSNLVIGTTGSTAKAGDYAPAWGDVTGKPAVIAAAATAALARTAIGAGTSELTLGTTATTAKAGNYTPSWYEVTDKPAFIGAGTTAALARTAIGAGTSDLTIGITSSTAKPGNYVPSWTDVTGKPSVIGAGSTAGDARAAIGAGTSSLVLGTTGSTAKAGNYTPSSTEIVQVLYAATSKATPADADEVPLIDSAASWAIKKLTWGALKTAVKAWLVAQANTWTGAQTFEAGALVSGGALGYTAGAGGTVTQATSKGTTVTLNKLSGKVLTHAQSIPAGAISAFVFGNNTVGAADCVVVNIGAIANSSNYSVRVGEISAGSFVVTLQNLSAGALAEAVPISFVVIKGAVA